MIKTNWITPWRTCCLAFALPLVACHSSKPSNDQTHSHQAHGVIEQISPDQSKVTIHHQAIPGYMMEMTMDFPVKDSHELDGLTPGDQVNFTLVVDTDESWVTDFQRTGHTSTNPANGMAMEDKTSPHLKPGDPIPDGELLTEYGKHIHLSDFRGKVVAFTFFFTRCPLPDYCPLMNRNFAQTRKLLSSMPKTPKNWQFISISFDADFDRPEALASYGNFYRGNDADRWLFASADSTALARLAPPLGLMIMGQDGTISHNLRTVVMDTQGRLYCQFNDNQWKAKDLAEAMQRADKLSPSK